MLLLMACGPSATTEPTKPPAQPPATTAAQPTAAVAQPTATKPAAAPTTATAKKTVLRLPEGAKITNTMDPGISSGGNGLEQIQNMFEPLLYVDQISGELKAGQAEKWTISPDGVTYTFNLRAGLKWSDGQPLKAGDFEYAWKRVTDPATKSRYTQYFYPIKGAEAFNTGKGTAADMMVKATDDRTLVVTLERPAPFFLQIVAAWSAMPIRKDTIDKNGDKWTLNKDTYISNGHYRLVEWKPEQSMRVEKNPNYWGDNPGPDEIVWTLFEDPNAQAIKSYEAGELDHAQVVGPDIPRIRADAKLSKEVQKLARQGSNWIVLDTTNPPFNNIKVRQALNYALDKAKINQVVLKDGYFDAVSVVAPGVPGQVNANGIGYDAAKAKQLLADAGYPGGKGWPANVKYTYSSSSADNKAIGEAVQAIWKDTLGIDIVLEPLEAKAFDDWRTSRKNQPYGMYINGWGSDYEDPNNWYNLLFDSKGDFYYSHWKNAQFDQLIDAGLKELDVAKRKALYEQADKILNDESAYITVYHWGRFVVTKPGYTIPRFRVLGRVMGYLVKMPQ
ncbi:MAG: peptide ABC transporter substrate-binding protein [Chloroflexi bacterium]|nr:peptide ABC transporter substrate-binding protein [Chloroflexota bacterium]